MIKLRVWHAFLLAMVAISQQVTAADAGSRYSQLASDTSVSNSGTTILQQTINLSTGTWVFVESDGRYYPNGGNPIGSVWIAVDGSQVSNLSVDDWSQSTNRKQHCFNAIGAVYLNPGSHTISLLAATLNPGVVVIGAESNLSTVINPATSVTNATMGADSAQLSYNTAGLTLLSPLPHSTQVSTSINAQAGASLIALASSRIYEWGNQGDPLTTITMDGQTPANNVGTWSDNDMNSGAEKQAPFFNHAIYNGLSNGFHVVGIDTSAIPYVGGTNTVQYRFGADSTLVTLSGGMSVFGSASLSSTQNNVANYVIIGSSNPSSGFPPTGTMYPIVQADIVIPSGHNGNVFITGKTRVQGDAGDQGGTVYFLMTIDGAQVGSLGVQQLASPNSASSRTMSTSYLATGSGALSPGTHHVVLYGEAVGSFAHLAMTQDLPLIWFD
ncbi:hypothetical protein ISN76_14065 [Dyella halodurans]|uniref:Uncharacterized protein n=1 Tax=Dyella halodurans TaxID=1920171 RepID=A0ABV9C5X3_9GAMM|nr:hypothetical protein [Dyella halodurans]